MAIRGRWTGWVFLTATMDGTWIESAIVHGSIPRGGGYPPFHHSHAAVQGVIKIGNAVLSDHPHLFSVLPRIGRSSYRRFRHLTLCDVPIFPQISDIIRLYGTADPQGPEAVIRMGAFLSGRLADGGPWGRACLDSIFARPVTEICAAQNPVAISDPALAARVLLGLNLEAAD